MTATRSYSYELEARPEHREAPQQTRPVPLRVAAGAWWWLRRIAHAAASPWTRALWRRLTALTNFAERHHRQRAQRGWADRDVWDLDTYLCGVIAGSVTRLRDTGDGHPNDLTQDDWHGTLTRIAEPLHTWSKGPRIVEGETTRARREREDQEYAEAQDALRLMADRLRDLWD